MSKLLWTEEVLAASRRYPTIEKELEYWVNRSKLPRIAEHAATRDDWLGVVATVCRYFGTTDFTGSFEGAGIYTVSVFFRSSESKRITVRSERSE